MTVFQHGVKPIYNPDLPHTTVVALRAFCSCVPHDKLQLDNLVWWLERKLSPDYDDIEFSCKLWSELVMPNNHVERLLVEALLHQSLYGYNKYGTVLQPNADVNKVLDFENESALELADFLNYATNLYLEKDKEKLTDTLSRLVVVVRVLSELNYNLHKEMQ